MKRLNVSATDGRLFGYDSVAKSGTDMIFILHRLRQRLAGNIVL